MLDVAWPELVVIGAVALVAIGPKDLPKAMHVLGRWAGKARRFAREMQNSFEQLSYESEIAEKLKNQPSATPSSAAPPQASASPPPTPDTSPAPEAKRE
jgi:sec-independent protein translocase protein TatB